MTIRALPSLLSLTILLLCGVARAADPPPPLTGSQAQALADTLQDDAKRAQLIATLRSLAAAAPTPTPGTPVAAPAPQPAHPATPPAAAPSAATQAPTATLQPGSVGEQVLGHATAWVGGLGAEIGTSVQDLRGVPALARWFEHLASDPRQRALVLHAAGIALLIVAVSALLMLALRRALRPLRRSLDHPVAVPEPDPRHGRAWRMAVRLPGAVGRVLLGLAPVAVFAIAGSILLETSLVALQATRVITLDVVDAYVLYRLILAVVDLLMAPGAARWRLLDVSDATAAYVMLWVRRLTGVALFGGLIATVAGVLGLPQSACQTILKLVGLLIHLGLIAIVWQCRHEAIAWRDRHRSFFVTFGGPEPQRAAIWASAASVFIILLWFVWAAQPGGFAHTLRLVLLTAGLVLAGRLASTVAVGALDRAVRVDTLAAHTRRRLWYRRARGALTATLVVLTLAAVLQGWGLDVAGLFDPGSIGPRLLSTFGTLAIVALIALVVWEVVVGTLERRMRALTDAGRSAQAQRLRTLAPLLRTCLLVAIVTIVALTALSEIGINVAPLLAGASIFGVALGFGSQKLVQDFITGIFLLLENAMQVGEWVTVAGLSGTVEQLSVRTIQLRGGDGSLYVIPFSSVTTVNNVNRGIGNASISVVVAGSVDTDIVGDAIKQIGADMRADPAFAASIRSDLALWGVDRIDATTATITGQIECTDSGRWGVQREFNRRVKKRFEELGIPLANPATVVVMQPPPSPTGDGPPHERDPGETAATVAASPPPPSGPQA